MFAGYITGLLNRDESERSRAELIKLIEAQLKTLHTMERKVEDMHIEVRNLVARELDAIVGKDQDLSWERDLLVVVSPGSGRESQISVEEAVERLKVSVVARRQELGIPQDSKGIGRDERPAEGDLIPPEQPTPGPSISDPIAEILSLPTEVLREKEQRRREAECD